jgi:hypothetical protein
MSRGEEIWYDDIYDIPLGTAFTAGLDTYTTLGYLVG